MPRVTQRSYSEKSVTQSSGPLPNVPRGMFSTPGRVSGIWPSGGSTTSEVWGKARRPKSKRNVLSASFSDRSTVCSTCCSRSANSSAVMYSRPSNLAGRDVPTPLMSSLDQAPCRSGSPHDVRGTV
jgi:hypothetical protein